MIGNKFVALNDDKTPKEKLSLGGRDLEEVVHYDNIGMLVPEPYIVLDFDTKSDAKIMYRIAIGLNLKCLIMATTRGYHFWFKSPKPMKNFTKTRLAVGLYADCRSYGKLSYVVVKKDGKWRDWVKTLEADEEVEEIPKFLTPVPFGGEFKGMKNNDGRNQVLYEYILTLQKSGFDKEEVKRTLNVINDYVFAEKIDDEEMEKITRDDAFLDDKELEITHCIDDKGKIIHNKFGDLLIKKFNIVTFNDRTYIYKNGYYQQDERLIEQAMITLIPTIKSHMRKEVMEYIRILTHLPSKNHKEDTYVINIKNGRLDVRTGELLDHNPEVVEFVRVPVTYIPEHYDEHVDKMLNKLFVNDMEVRDLFEEMIGYCLIRNTRYQRGFLFYGEGSNGKSTMLEMIRNFLGHANVTSTDLTKLHENYAVAELEHKLANIGDDIESNKLKETGTIKRLFTGESITARRIYGSPFSLYSYAKMIFAANKIPYSADKSHGFFRRFEFIPLQATISPSDEDYDPFILDKVTTESAKSYLLNIALEGLNRLMKNGDFTKPKTVQRAKEEYKTTNSHVLFWISENNITVEDLKSRPIAEWYGEFSDYCKLSGIRNKTNRPNFTKEINTEFNLKSVPKWHDGKTQRMFAEDD